MKLNIDNLNSRLADYKQVSRISSYSPNPRIVILNKIEYRGNAALRIIRRIRGDELWIKNFDKIYLLFEKDAEKIVKSLISSKGGKEVQSRHGISIQKNLNTGVPWNAGMRGHYPYTSWCKGLTKDTDSRLLSLSVNRTGNRNLMFGVRMSDEDKKIKSDIMKQKILDGIFTPNSNNRNTHWGSHFRDKKFRSSWEAIYYSLNRDDLYESLRIKYIYESKEYIYIVDFVNHISKVATEIKPKELLIRAKEKAKINALDIWCKENRYRMNIITQDNIGIMSSSVDIIDFDAKTQDKIRSLNETYKKNRDRKI